MLRALQRMKRTELPFAIVTVICGAAAANTIVKRRVEFTADGFSNAVRMLMVFGHSYETAMKMALAFYRGQPAANDASNAALFNEGRIPENWHRTAPLILYPYAAAQLFEYRGFESLTDLSRASLVGTGAATYSLLRNFTAPWLSASLAVALVMAPRVRRVTATDRTHGPALFLWTVTLDAMCRSIKCSTASQFVYTLSCFALTFTRPVPYLPFGAAACALCVAIAKAHHPKQKAAGGLTAVAMLSIVALRFVAHQLKAPSTRDLIAATHERVLNERKHQDYARMGFFERMTLVMTRDAGPQQQALVPWYLRALAICMTNAVARATLAVAPIVGAAGIIKCRKDPCAPLMVGAVLGSSIGILRDPVPSEVSESILLPLYPVVAAGCALAADFLIDCFLGDGAV